MYKWYLPTLSEVVAREEQTRQPGFAAQQRVRAEREWTGAIAALHLLLHQSLNPPGGEKSATTPAPKPTPRSRKKTPPPCTAGIVLSGPLPVLEQPELVTHFSTWTFVANPLDANGWMPFHLLPSADQAGCNAGTSTVSLLPNDPVAAEQFCLVMTPHLSLVMVLGEDGDGNPAFLFSFDPEIIREAWQALRARLLFTNPMTLRQIDGLLASLTLQDPNYRTVTQFSRLMLAHLPEPLDWESEAIAPLTAATEPVMLDRVLAEPAGTASRWHLLPTIALSPQTLPTNGKTPRSPRPAAQPANPERSLENLAQDNNQFDAELLQAIAHEVRTPLTTIRTLTRLLLKRKDLSPDVLKRLEVIDRECTEQIDRFNLIFRAVEIETATVKHPLTPLAPIPLDQVLKQNIPRWQQQATQHNLTLEVKLPQKLPMVVTDPTMLDQVLTGLIDRITQTLPPGSHIQLHVTLAGHQLKLQFQSQPHPAADAEGRTHSSCVPPLKSLGQLLMFQPETGSLSLNLAVTKNLFQALGGKLIVRQRPEQGEVLTVFLPLETRRADEES